MSDNRVIKTAGNWNYEKQNFHGANAIGGAWPVPNLSGFYHGILQQWWQNHFPRVKDCLLISENVHVKQHFENNYSNIKFFTNDHPESDQKPVDISHDLCVPWSTYNAFDAIICQATLEHLYDPMTAMKNMNIALKSGGEIYIHTHTPGYPYHNHPRDYFRFQPDWFIDLPKYVKNLELKELCEFDNHIFSLYKKF